VLDFKTVFALLIASRDKTEENAIDLILANSLKDIIAKNLELLDDKELDNCDPDEQVVTYSFENL